MASQNMDYSSVSHSYSNRSYFLSNYGREGYYGPDGDVGGGDGTRTTHLSPQNLIL